MLVLESCVWLVGEFVCMGDWDVIVVIIYFVFSLKSVDLCYGC